MTDVTAFSERERKLFRQRPVLAVVAVVTALLALTLMGLKIGGWGIAVALLCLPVLFIGAAGLAASEQASDLKRFDTALGEADLQAASEARKLRGIARNAFLFICLAMLMTSRLGSDPFLVVMLAIAAAGCALYARRLFFREVAIMRKVADLPA